MTRDLSRVGVVIGILLSGLFLIYAIYCYKKSRSLVE